MTRQYELVDHVRSYDQNVDEDLLNRAYIFANKAHGPQTRACGAAYITHPLEVADILAGYRLDSATIATALLHDTIEDTDATSEEIRRMFGRDIERLVDGVTKLTKIELHSERTKQGENFRKLVIAMSDDIRVLLVKLADRLHNMRTLSGIKDPAKRRRIANETMDIYAPLAERVGMNEMKDELEDLAFIEINRDARNSIIAHLEYLREQQGDVITEILQGLRQTTKTAGMRGAVVGREKTPYSVWQKMQWKNVGFEQLSDIMAFRVIVGTLEDCYRALGVINTAYPVVPGRLKDYISTPKRNGYQSLHTCVLGPGKHRVEVQIRTREMHEVAEYGVAAHWMYKAGLSSTEGHRYRWLRALRDVLDHAAGPEEFLEHTKLEMFEDQVFCFTPKGEVIGLPTGATAVDFAYAVHSEVGDHCVGAKINSRMMPLRTPLNNGDQVEIITSKAQTPSPTWEKFVITGKARARIRRFIRSKEREQYLTLGRSLVQRAFREESCDYYDKAIEGVLKSFKMASVDDLFAQVGAGYITARAVLEAVFPGTRRKKAFFDKVVPLGRARQRRAKKEKGREPPLPIRGLIDGMAVHFAGCCHPLPGDRIVGIVTAGKGITIHTIDCESLGAYSDTPDRWIDVSWDVDPDSSEMHTGRIHLTVLNETGALSELTSIIARYEGNITNLKITNRAQQFFDMMIDIEVNDVKHLTEIIAALRAAPAVNSVDRAYG